LRRRSTSFNVGKKELEREVKKREPRSGKRVEGGKFVDEDTEKAIGTERDLKVDHQKKTGIGEKPITEVSSMSTEALKEKLSQRGKGKKKKSDSLCKGGSITEKKKGFFLSTLQASNRT